MACSSSAASPVQESKAVLYRFKLSPPAMMSENRSVTVVEQLLPAPAMYQLEPSPYLQGSIVDIGGSNFKETLNLLLQEKMFGLHGHQLRKVDGSSQHLLPSPMFSDDKGLALWHEVNRLTDYYQTCDEIELFETHGRMIAEQVPEGASILDLGCGDVRKIAPFLDILEANQKRVQYFALDVSRKSLETGMREFAAKYKFVRCVALWGLFQDGLQWIEHIPSPRWICSLGSSLGNDWYTPAVANLRRWSGVMEQEDRLLLGMDSCKDREILRRSYHDKQGLFESFIRNGLEHSASVMGDEWYHPDDWTVSGIFHDEPVMHQFAITAKRDISFRSIGVELKKGTQIDCYEAFKYDPQEMQAQFKASGLRQQDMWQSSSNRIFQYLLAPVK